MSSNALERGERVGLHPLTAADGEEFVRRARESRAHHHPWIALPQDTPEFAAHLERVTTNPATCPYVLRSLEDGSLSGFVNINAIVRGAFQSGALGYAAFAHAAGRGHLREGIALVVRHAFGPLGLHRLEINLQPGNERSRGLAVGAGFRREGFSPDYLFVDGAWRDHERWALTREMRSTERQEQATGAE